MIGRGWSRRTRGRGPGGRPVALAVVALMILAPGLLVAQEDPPDDAPRTRTVKGRVVDASTGAPLSSVWIQVVDAKRGTLSNPDGAWVLPQVPHGEAWITFEGLGYFTETLWVAPSGDLELETGKSVMVETALNPDAIVLEGLSVVVNQMGRRRKAVATSVWAFEGENLMFSPYQTTLDHLEARMGLRVTPCPLSGFSHDCAIVRGRPTRVSVWVDEAPMIGGLSYLDIVAPHEVHTVEVYGGGRHIRVYTAMFMERLAKHPRTLMPIGIR